MILTLTLTLISPDPPNRTPAHPPGRPACLSALRAPSIRRAPPPQAGFRSQVASLQGELTSASASGSDALQDALADSQANERHETNLRLQAQKGAQELQESFQRQLDGARAREVSPEERVRSRVPPLNTIVHNCSQNNCSQLFTIVHNFSQLFTIVVNHCCRRAPRTPCSRRRRRRAR